MAPTAGSRFPYTTHQQQKPAAAALPRAKSSINLSCCTDKSRPCPLGTKRLAATQGWHLVVTVLNQVCGPHSRMNERRGLCVAAACCSSLTCVLGRRVATGKAEILPLEIGGLLSL